MMPTAEQERWEVLEKIGAYAAGELEGEEAQEAERLIFERPDHRRLAESYARMLVMLDTLGSEPVEVPEAVINFALRRAYVSAFMRSAEVLISSLGRSYLDAFVYYLGLRPGPAREAERLIFERPDHRRLAESYARMLVMLDTLGSEPVEVPEAVVNFALRRAYVSAFMRSAEVLISSLGRSYLDAFVYYLGLRPGPAREGYGGGF